MSTQRYSVAPQANGSQNPAMVRGALMITDLKPYAEYKATTQAWLGDVPRHWYVLPNRALFGEVNDRNHADEEMLSVTITRGIVRQKALLEASSKKDGSNLDKSAYKLVQPRDIAYNKMRAWQGAIGASDFRGIISPAYVVMRLRNDANLPSYYHHLYRTPHFAKEAERWSYGITSDMWSLRPEHFKMIYTPEPPPAEQAAIVRFLEWMNGRLERATRAKRKVIALLNEQKQAIIHRAITRGLDASVPLKPSGIPWLGEIPQHWDSGKIKRFFKTCSGATPTSGQISIYYDGPIPWIRTMDLTNGIVDHYVVGITQRAIQDTACRILPIGSVLVAMYGGAGTIGKNGLLAIEAATNQALCALLPNYRFEPKFVLFFMQSHRRYWMVGADGTRKDPNISQSRIRECLMVAPPRSEQREIVVYVEEHTSGLDTAASRLEREIELLREYRTGLTADVVTGKLDVRAAAARLPEEGAPAATRDDVDLSTDSEAADEEAVV